MIRREGRQSHRREQSPRRERSEPKRRAGGLLLAATLVASGGMAGVGEASHCDTRLSIIGRTSGIEAGFSVNACERFDHHADGRILYPWSDQVELLMWEDFGAENPTVWGHLDGLGLANEIVALTRTVNSVGQVYYSSPRVNLPGGMAQSGCLHATVTLPGGDVEAASVRSLDSSCPDFQSGP